MGASCIPSCVSHLLRGLSLPAGEGRWKSPARYKAPRAFSFRLLQVGSAHRISKLHQVMTKTPPRTRHLGRSGGDRGVDADFGLQEQRGLGGGLSPRLSPQDGDELLAPGTGRDGKAPVGCSIPRGHPSPCGVLPPPPLSGQFGFLLPSLNPPWSVGFGGRQCPYRASHRPVLHLTPTIAIGPLPAPPSTPIWAPG